MPLDGTIIQAIRPKITVPAGLVGHWPFDLKDLNWTAGVAYDRSGRNNHGSLGGMGSTILVAGKINQALTFNGVDQYVTVSDAANLNSTAAATYCAWVKATSFPNSYNAVMHKGSASAYMEFYAKSDGKLAMYVGASAAVFYDGSGATTLVAGRWYHLAMVYSAALGLRGYVNGRLDGSASPNGAIGDMSGTVLSIGRDSVTAGRVFGGAVDDPRAYNRDLRAQEILSIYEAGRCGRP